MCVVRTDEWAGSLDRGVAGELFALDSREC